MNQMKKILQIINSIVLILIVCFLTFDTIFVINHNLDYLNLSKYLSYFGIICIILYVIHKIVYKETIKLKDIIMLILAALAYISYYFALDPLLALQGAIGRNEGLRVILTYYTIFLLATTLPKNKQKLILSVFLATGVIQIIIGTIQTLGLLNIFGYSRVGRFSTNFKFASGTFGNPNFYSTYILIGFMYCYGNLIKSKSKSAIIIYSILTFVFAYGLVIGNTTSCFLAAGVVIVFTLCKKINKNNFKKVLLGIFIITPIIVSSVLILNHFVNHRITYTMNKNIEEIKDIFKYGISDKTGNNRIYIWKQTLKYVPKYALTGIGIDNFSLINNGNYLCSGEGTNFQCFDKAHNELLQILITEGVFAFLVYVFFLLYTIYVFVHQKKYEDKHIYALFLAFISYIIQGMFNISVITVAPILYMLIGFIHYDKVENC